MAGNVFESNDGRRRAINANELSSAKLDLVQLKLAAAESETKRREMKSELRDVVDKKKKSTLAVVRTANES